MSACSRISLPASQCSPGSSSYGSAYVRRDSGKWLYSVYGIVEVAALALKDHHRNRVLRPQGQPGFASETLLCLSRTGFEAGWMFPMTYRATEGCSLCLQKTLALARESLPIFSTTWIIMCNQPDSRHKRSDPQRNYNHLEHLASWTRLFIPKHPK